MKHSVIKKVRGSKITNLSPSISINVCYNNAHEREKLIKIKPCMTFFFKFILWLLSAIYSFVSKLLFNQNYSIKEDVYFNIKLVTYLGSDKN